MKRFSSDIAAAAYLAAFFDGEGHVADWFTGAARRRGARVLNIVNTDVSLVSAVEDALDQLGILHHSSVRQPRGAQRDGLPYAPVHVVTVRASLENLGRFEDLVPLQSPDKRRKLREMVRSYEDPRIDERVDLDADILMRLYAQGAGLGTLARQFGASQTAIQARLRRLGVQFRDRVEVSTRTDIDGAEACRLYTDDHLSLDAIAERLGCSRRAIVNRLRKAGVPTRTNSAAQQIRRHGLYVVASDDQTKLTG